MAEGRYTRIKSRFWVDEKVRGWSDDTKLLALYLLTSPHNNMLGCYVLPKLYICEDLDWEPERLEEPFAKLLDDGFIKYDTKARLILLTNYLKHNTIDNPNRAEAAIKLLDELPKSDLFWELKAIVEQQGKKHLEKLAQSLENQAPKPSTKQLEKPFSKPFQEGLGEGNAKPATATATADPNLNNNKNNNAELPETYKAFENEFARPLSPMEIERIIGWYKEIGGTMTVEALRRAVLHGKLNFSYIDKIVLEWVKNKILSPADLVEYDKRKPKKQRASPEDKIKRLEAL